MSATLEPPCIPNMHVCNARAGIERARATWHDRLGTTDDDPTLHMTHGILLLPQRPSGASFVVQISPSISWRNGSISMDH